MAVVVGTNNNDTLSGTANIDTLQGGLGNDTLKGGVGSDVYVFNKGDGVDLIDDYNGSGVAENNIIRLGADFTLNDLRISNEAGHMVIRFANSANDSITIRYHFYGDSRWLVSGIQLNDDSVIDISLSSTAYTLYSSTTDAGGTVDSNYMGVDIITGGNGNDIFYSHAGNDILVANGGDDKLYGEDGGDNLEAGAGNDTLRGGNGGDFLSGGEGVDDLDGQNGDDTLVGGLGADTVKGGVGSDTYIFNKGDGADYIEDYNNSGLAETNIIKLGAGITLQNLRFSLEGSDNLVVRFSNTPDDSITLVNHFYYSDSRNISKIVFADNSYLDISKTSTAYLLYSNATDTGGTIDSDYIGNDSITGAAGDDTIYSNAGNDTIIGAAGNDRLYGEDGNDSLKGGTGNDTLKGGAGNDVLNGEMGEDSLEGGDGDDIYYVDNINDRINDSSGVDTVHINTDNYRATGIENIIYQQDTVKLAYFVEALQSGSSWATTVTTSVNVNFSFAETSDLVGFRTYTDAEKNIARSILNEYAQVSGLTFTETTDSDAVQIRFFIDDTPGEGGASGYAYYPKHGDIHMDNSYSTSYHVYIHEIGHALGLKHSFEADADSIALPASEDNTINTNMSYSGSWSYRGLRIFDLAAIHYLYGVNNSQRIANETYTQTDRYIWDGAGVDTVSVATATQNAYVDLRDGAWSYIGAKSDSILADNQFFIGIDTDIENAIGGQANDVLRGNELANCLTGGLGNDTLNGGDGQDTACYSGNWSQYTITGTATNATIVGAEGADNLLNMEFLSFNGVIVSILDVLDIKILLGSSGNDNLIGTNSHDGISAIEGNDTLIGGQGNDTLDGGLGADILDGGMDNDFYYVDDVADNVINETLTGGIDSIFSTVNYSLSGRYVENLTLIGAESINGTGNTLNNVLTGNSGNNTLLGVGGNDTLDGGLGADVLDGGAGDDVYYVDDIADNVINESSTGGIDSICSSVSYNLGGRYVENLILTETININAIGNSLNNVLTGNIANNLLNGLAGNDSLMGSAGNDTLDGGIGVDILDGGVGDDVYYVDAAADNVINEVLTGGIDSIFSTVSYSLSGRYVENLTLIGAENINATGNGLDNNLIGNSGNNILNGSAGNDILNGGVGIDTLDGGAGDDIYYIDNVNDNVINELLTGGGIDSIFSTVSYSLSGRYVENLTLIGAENINATGNGLDNKLIGNNGNNILNGSVGNDILNGGAGTDTLDGGAGDDIYYIDNVNDNVVNELLTDGGIDSIFSTVSYSLGGRYVENLSLTGISSINGVGNSLNNVITGNSGHNSLDGGAGLDTLIGGLGNDIYLVDTSTDSIIELANEGIDTIQSSISFSLIAIAQIENLTLTGISSINAVGNSLNNVITGNSGQNCLDGGVGLDTLIGGLGNDIYLVDTSTESIIELANEGTDTIQSSVMFSLATIAYVENLTLTGVSSINGVGNNLNNVITGNGGHNSLDGGAGLDILIGGLGDDIYLVDTTTDSIIELANEGIDTIQSSVTFSLAAIAHIENLSLTGTANINATGNSLSNVLTGNSGNNTLLGATGNDTLDGGLGIDILDGGLGDDTYYVDDISDNVINENSTGGIDSIFSTVSYSLGGRYVENLSLTGAGNINATGNSLSNVLKGNSGNNILTGATGNDSYVFGVGGGQDTIIDTSGSLDVLSVLSGVSEQQLWFKQVGNNLEVSIIGTTDKATISNWYVGGTANQLEEIRTATGDVLLASQVQNLVNAMSSFSAPPVGTTTLDSGTYASVLSVIAANWS